MATSNTTDTSNTTSSPTTSDINRISKTARWAKYISFIVAVVLIAAIWICAYQLHCANKKIERTEKKIEILTNTIGPHIYLLDENDVRLMTIEAAQKEFDSYIDSQSNLLTIFTILITAMVALLGVGGPILINREQGNANKEKIGNEVAKGVKGLKAETEKQVNDIKTKTEQIDKAIQTAQDDAENKVKDLETKTRVELNAAKARIDKMEEDIKGILEDLQKQRENYNETKAIEQKAVEKRITDDEKLVAYEELENQGKASSNVFYEIGSIYLNKGNFKEACNYFAKAVENRKNYAEVYPLWANALESQDKLAEAWEKREKAIALNPNDSELKDKQNSLLDRILTHESPLAEKETIECGGVKFDMILVRKGVFTMGATEEQGNDAWDDGRPNHRVMLRDYYIGETVVTQALWEAVMRDNRSRFKGKDLPVEKVSWNDCQGFICKLNQLTEKRFRLPTEAEWEYAARGGKKSKNYKFAGSNTIDDVAWYGGNSEGRTHEVKTKSPNELGIYDMSGNVWEWCQDWYNYYESDSQNNPTGPLNGSDRVLRGGSWDYVEGYCRVSDRGYIDPKRRSVSVGFRLVLPL